MRLLIITQKVDENDDILGFFTGWIAEFAKNCEKVTVICLQKGEFNLPDNVKVLSLGKEQLSAISHQPSALQKFKYVFNFYKYILGERKNYDSVFVHMNPEYIILGAPLWKLWRKKITLWYTHKQVDLKLRLAEKLADKIFSAAKESFRLPTEKLKVMGHGIPVGAFRCERKKGVEDVVSIVSVGRISRIKNPDILVLCADILNKKWNKSFIIKLVGPTITSDDRRFYLELEKLIRNKGLGNKVVFEGSVANKDIARYYCDSSLSVNLAPTGGVDKVVLESMASGMPVFTSNKAFIDYFGDYAKDLIFNKNDASNLAEKIMAVYHEGKKEKIGEFLREIVVKKSDLGILAKKIIKEII